MILPISACYSLFQKSLPKEVVFSFPRKDSWNMITISEENFPQNRWQLFKDKYFQTLSRYRAGCLKKPRIFPRSMFDIRRLIDFGRPPEKAAKRRESIRAIENAKSQLVDLIKNQIGSNKAPQKVILYTEGADACGKTSTGQVVLDAFAEAGYMVREHGFKAPTQEERQEHWLNRFSRQLPVIGEVVRWDRGPAGNAAYQNLSSSDFTRMAEDFQSFEHWLKDQGILLIKVYLHALPEKQAKTLGKRYARAEVAQEIKDHQIVTRGLKSQLKPVINAIGPADISALQSFDLVHHNFLNFIYATSHHKNWYMIDSTHRKDAKIETIKNVGLEIMNQHPIA